MNIQIRQQFLGEHSTERLQGICAGVIGLGGGGSHIAQQLAHVGLGRFVLVDFDKYEDKNHNRTVGGELGDIARAPYKVHIAERMIRRVNPAAEVLAINAEWQSALPPLRGCDVLFGCLDSFAQRDQLERLSRRYLIPYIDVGMDVHHGPAGHSIHGQVILSLPGGLCMRCFNFLRDELLEQEARQYGTGGGRPQVVWPNGVLASSAVGIFMQMVTPWHQRVFSGSTMLDYDGNLHRIAVSPRVEALFGRACDHFDNPSDIGDPFWRPAEGARKPVKYPFLRGIVNALRRANKGFRKE
jgi:hypothetical protein